MEYDVIVVGGGPAGLAAAIRLKQLAAADSREISVCLLDKGTEIGAHILSGAILETRALDELLPDWQSRSSHTGVAVATDEFHYLSSATGSLRMPAWLLPASMHNAGNRIVSLGRLCRWLGEEAAAMDVDVLPGFAAAELLRSDAGGVAGVVTGDVGRTRDGSRKDRFEPGVALRGRYTILAEGARGHLTHRVIRTFGLDEGRDPQHYGIGLKELWQVDSPRHSAGRVLHGAGWPLGANASGGFFAYHLHDSLLAVGLVADLNYRNPWLDPFREFQRLKLHPLLAATLAGGQRVAYGARAIAKGGFNSLPKLSLPGAILTGCAAGTLNYAKIKGIHMAMKSAMLGAESVYRAVCEGRAHDTPDGYDSAFAASWAGRELEAARNFGPALHHFGTPVGGAFNLLDQTVFRGRTPFTLRDRVPDHDRLRPARECTAIDYPKPDGRLSFDRNSSVHLSGTHHGEDQPCHLLLTDPTLAVEHNLRLFAGPEQRYCPAGVYEFLDTDTGPRLQINAQNCVHCKVCDIKDPRQNIIWVPPEPGGPVYTEM